MHFKAYKTAQKAAKKAAKAALSKIAREGFAGDARGSLLSLRLRRRRQIPAYHS